MEQLTVERLKVRRDWYKGLAADPIDHSHPDVGDGDEPPAAARRVGLQVSASPCRLGRLHPAVMLPKSSLGR